MSRVRPYLAGGCRLQVAQWLGRCCHKIESKAIIFKIQFSSNFLSINILTTTIIYSFDRSFSKQQYYIYSSHPSSCMISVSESVKFWFIKPAKRYFLHEDMWLQSSTWSRWCWTCRVCWRPSWWRSGLPSPWRREQCAARQILRILQSQYLLSKYLISQFDSTPHQSDEPDRTWCWRRSSVLSAPQI